MTVCGSSSKEWDRDGGGRQLCPSRLPHTHGHVIVLAVAPSMVVASSSSSSSAAATARSCGGGLALVHIGYTRAHTHTIRQNAIYIRSRIHGSRRARMPTTSGACVIISRRGWGGKKTNRRRTHTHNIRVYALRTLGKRGERR